MNPNNSIKARLVCKRGHEPHEVCVDIGRGVPPDLRCEPGQPSGINRSGGGCPVPADLAERVDREFRDNVQESKRRGYVLVQI
jgi:hypothetical protein